MLVLCMERLCHLIDMAVVEKKWKPIRLSRRGPHLSHVCFADDLILFAEASIAQIRVIRRILEQFGVASGQVSLEKSKIYFSENVNREMGKLISDESGTGAIRDLGKYLGMPVLQKRINNNTSGKVLKKVSSRLAGWKGQMRSLAGRITLTKAVLSSITVHTMSSIMLPQSTLARLDKTLRSFLWGDSIDRRRQHLVSWNRVCHPKREGGLGIQKSKDMNKFSKLSWRLLHDDKSLWVQTLWSKYKVGDIRDAAWLKKVGNWSSTWRSILQGMHEVVISGFSCVIGDGNNIRFWRDRWLSQTPLLEEVTMDVPMEMKASEMWQRGEGLISHQIAQYITEQTHLQLAVVLLDDITGARDRLSWGHNQNGAFLGTPAYLG
ncbi:unnamed protein product [Microthlaspi erraticum]|uniref:Reverse transcriptase domain-containing protein n=1 Tax=Microthlaspi erraticum TaxID=1685480 RepID=A0A6D2HW35_9BRAS|nr:unnamed protein product [Microthlaspi erraticum]